MEVKDILRKTDRQIAYYENIDFYKDMSKIDDMGYFIQVMDSKKDTRLSIETGIIWMSLKEKKEDFEILFLDKYRKYLEIILEKDVREYYNNLYCNYLFGIFESSLNNENDYKDKKFINGKSFDEIDTLVTNKYNEIMEKFYNKEDIGGLDRLFIEETFLLLAYNDSIYKEIDGEHDLMYDIVNFFKKYPIDDISNSRSRQLYLLSLLSSRMVNLPGNSAIQFCDKIIKNNDGTELLGFFGKDESDNPVVTINELDVYNVKTEEEFLRKIFTVFHELGHYIQNTDFDNYRDNIKDIIAMEKDLIKNDRDFYNKYHDSFFIERDADNYATIEIIKEFGKKYPEIVSKIVDRKQSKKRIDSSEFYLMELEEYSNIIKGNEKRVAK